MKKILQLIFLFTSLVSSAQLVIDDIGYKPIYTSVNEIDLKKEEIKLNTETWLVEKFKNTNNGIKLNNDEKIIGKGSFEGLLINGIGGKGSCSINYIMNIEFKDQKYRLKIHSFSFDSQEYGLFALQLFKYSTKDLESFKESILTYSETESGSLKKRLIKMSENPKKLLKFYEYTKTRDDFMLDQIKAECEQLNASLKTNLIKLQKEEW
ncbi:DUF4468 domain-containing protein [Tenacibaculum caenipelagi]|uniref:Uncharacterized protein with TBP-like fold DUF4468 n=1 Tax=Tenacibaculum caenipelagi TaxID=1325435 RepID=A0A4R6TFX5_9FLAO|nr:DUF4468 domain-containing protein [Tenacibaculum caenipelagi]TDQ27690.1 uncharacterized protein with TBP-like fold DUF4468 [Tenacibaculum caenipelagi]